MLTNDTPTRLPVFQRMLPRLRARIRVLLIGNLAVLAYLFLYSITRDNVSFATELSQMGPNLAPTLLAGMGLTFVIITGAIDLSIGGQVVLAGTVFGILYAAEQPPWICFAACSAAPCVLSLFNALLIRVSRLPAIIVTLAGLTAYRGLALILADIAIADFGGQFSVTDDAYHAPGRDYAAGIAAVMLGLAWMWEANGRWPRLWQAVGSSAEACRLSGLQPQRIISLAFLTSGVFLGFASLTYVTNRLTIEPTRMALGFELEVIAAVVLGGANIFGGEGSVLGTALGALFLYLVGQSMIYAGVSEYWRTAIQGAVILIVIGLDCGLKRRHQQLEELR